MSTMSWSGILDLLISIYADKDDDYLDLHLIPRNREE